MHFWACTCMWQVAGEREWKHELPLNETHSRAGSASELSRGRKETELITITIRGVAVSELNTKDPDNTEPSSKLEAQAFLYSMFLNDLMLSIVFVLASVRVH